MLLSFLLPQLTFLGPGTPIILLGLALIGSLAILVIKRNWQNRRL